MLYPSNSTTTFIYRTTAGNSVIIPTSTTPITILSYSLSSKDSSLHTLKCKNDTIAYNLSTGQKVYDRYLYYPAGTQCSITTVSASDVWTYFVWTPYIFQDMQTATEYPTSSPFYQAKYNEASLLWLIFLILSAGTFFSICYFFYKQFKK